MKADKKSVAHKLKIARGQLDGILKMIEEDRKMMKKAAAELEFTQAAAYRDEMWALQEYLKVWKD